MSRINFNNCSTIGDLAQNYGEQLAGKALVQHYGTSIEDCVIFPAPIHNVDSSSSYVTFTTENVVNGLIALTFSKRLEVATSIYEPGDIWWSPDRYQKSMFNIDDMPDDFFADDPVLKESMLVPVARV